MNKNIIKNTIFLIILKNKKEENKIRLLIHRRKTIPPFLFFLSYFFFLGVSRVLAERERYNPQICICALTACVMNTVKPSHCVPHCVPLCALVHWLLFQQRTLAFCTYIGAYIIKRHTCRTHNLGII